MIKAKLIEKVNSAVKQAGFETGGVSDSIFRGKFGDYSSNIAFKLAEAGSSSQPAGIAKKIVTGLKNDSTFEKVEIAAPGFINLYVSQETLTAEMQIIAERGENYSKIDINSGKSARVEYISANPTGPLHLGNARGGPLGNAIANVLAESGYTVLREYIHNDVGGQVERLGRSILHYIKIQQNIPSELEDDGYQGEYVKDLAADIAREFDAKKLIADDAQSLKTVADFALKKIFDENLVVVESMGIDLDKIFNEGDFLKSGQTKAILAKLTKGGFTKRKDGAVWFAPNDDYLADREAVLVKSNGEPTYFANDIAYHDLKFKSDPDLVIDIFGSNHHGHVPKLQAAILALGYDPKKFRVILYQYVRLKKGNEIVKMSKRAGTYVTAKEVLDEVGKDAFSFFLLQRGPETHMDFDLEAAKKQSVANPVYYVQYAHARMCSILEKAGFDKSIKWDSKYIKESHELNLLKKMVVLPELVEDLSTNFAVHQLTGYALELADSFNSFYEACRVITDDSATTAARLNLVYTAKIVLGNTLRLLGVSAPERM